MVWTGPVRQGRNWNGWPVADLPPAPVVMPELTDDDVAWLNRQMWLSGLPGPSRYTNAPPQPSPPPTGWITTTQIRG